MWTAPWCQRVEVQSLTESRIGSKLPSTLAAWEAKFAGSRHCKMEHRTTAPLDVATGALEFSKWLERYLPPQEVALPALKPITDTSWLWGYLADLSVTDIEAGALGCTRLWLAGSAMICCAPVSTIADLAGRQLRDLADAGSVMLELYESDIASRSCCFCSHVEAPCLVFIPSGYMVATQVTNNRLAFGLRRVVIPEPTSMESFVSLQLIQKWFAEAGPVAQPNMSLLAALLPAVASKDEPEEPKSNPHRKKRVAWDANLVSICQVDTQSRTVYHLGGEGSPTP